MSIALHHVSKVFQTKKTRVEALKQVSLDIETGKIYGIVGYSGAGKSTLLRLINGLENPDTGEVVVDGKVISHLKGKELNAVRKQIGMVFQQFSLLDSQTVYQNLRIPLLLAKKSAREIEDRITELLDFVELSDKRDVPVSKLSGGQKQRVGIARALANQPSILLCDEATSALDPKTTTAILKLLQKINRTLGVTIVLITHEMDVVRQICDKVAIMREGEIIEQGDVTSVFLSPQTSLAKDFIGTILNQDIPQYFQKQLDPNYPVVRLSFTGEATDQALLSQVNKRFNVVTRILSASVNELAQTVIGVLLIQIEGEDSEIERVIDFIQSEKVKLERVAYD